MIDGSETPFSGCGVLVDKDEVLTALELSRMLGDLGCDVVGPAASIDKALALLETQRPDMALLDEALQGKLTMPLNFIAINEGGKTGCGICPHL
jgi:AmiR/NasT family two-component response regulator